MPKTRNKILGGPDAEAVKRFIESIESWSNKLRLRECELPDVISGVPSMPGYEGTFFSGSYMDPEGDIVGSLDVIREDVSYEVGEVGRFKKYQYKVYMDADKNPVGLTVREFPKKKLSKHHSSEIEDEFRPYLSDEEQG